MDKELTKKRAISLLLSNDVNIVTDTLLHISFNFKDWEWVQNICLKLINHKSEDVRGLAITCLGHIARIHCKIDKEKVIPILLNINDKSLSGRIQDALEDIQMFTT